MEQVAIRLLKAEEIECRISTINEKGLTLLLYKDARVDQRILDETFGLFGWQRSHQIIDGNLYCTVSIYDSDKEQWISKQDVGTTGFTEKEKSQASDSFKRACFNIGIGRELYSAPFIWIKADKANVQKRNDKYVSNSRFKVTSISYTPEREIESLTIIDEGSGEVVYTYNSKKTNQGINMNQLQKLKAEMTKKNVSEEKVLKRYKVQSFEELTKENYESAMRSLAKTA